MKDKDYSNLIHLKNVGGGFVPANEKAEELMLLSRKGDVIPFEQCSKRDVSFHRCYMSLISFIWGYMPPQFQKKVPQRVFYKWLKHLRGQYEKQFSFIDDEKISDILDLCIELELTPEQSSTIAAKFGKTDMVEYESISFGRMDQHKFKEYVADQLPWIYENVVGKYFEGDIYNNIIETIEEEYKKFLIKLL